MKKAFCETPDVTNTFRGLNELDTFVQLYCCSDERPVYYLNLITVFFKHSPPNPQKSTNVNRTPQKPTEKTHIF